MIAHLICSRLTGILRERCISYPITKTAQNQETVTIAHELKAEGAQITMPPIDPCDVRACLRRGIGKISIGDSVREILYVVGTATSEDSGNSLRWVGEEFSF